MRGGVAVLLLLSAVSSCRQIIGVDEAVLDTAGAAAVAGSGAAGAQAGVGPSLGGAPSSGGQAASGSAGDTAGSEAGGTSGTTGGESGGTSSDAGAAGQPSQLPTTCESYCDAALENCTGSLAIYTSREMCLAVCALLPEGTPGDGELEVNSVHCRWEAAVAAGVSEPEYSCPIAAPGGNGKCGSNCENLCSLRTTVCSEWVTGDATECLMECAGLPDLQSYTVDPDAKPSHTRGEHVQCRIYHLSAAATDEPDTHCLHADGAPPCIGQ